MRKYRMSQASSFKGGGFVMLHLRHDVERTQYHVQVTICRPVKVTDSVSYNEVKLQLFDGSKKLVKFTPAHPPSFVRIDNQDMGLYKIGLKEFTQAKTAIVLFQGKEHKFELKPSAILP